MSFKVGETKYLIGHEDDPTIVGHSQYVLVNGDGAPLLMERRDGAEYISFNRLPNARSRAREIHMLGEGNPQVGVFDKRKGQVVFAA